MPFRRYSRREALRLALASAVPVALPRGALRAFDAEPARLPSARPITRGPKFHWFGYYDKLEIDPTGRYVLANQVDFEHRSPRAGDSIRVGMVDLEDSDRWIELGGSQAWCWQQGCMLQWRPGTKSEVLWNDRDGDRFLCRVLDVVTGKTRTVPHPVYAVSPCGKWAVSADFRRINDMRPGYGYAGPSDPHGDDPAPKESGIFRVDLETGESELLLSLADVAAIPFPGHDAAGAKHWFNHLLVNPDGSRFEFLHRSTKGNGAGRVTRMLTASKDGSDLRVIDPSGRTSHFIWRDSQHILAWSRHAPHGDAFYLFEDREGGKVEVVGKGVMTVDGHCSYLPGGEWILNDTYPQGEDRVQTLYLYHVRTGEKRVLGEFRSPADYRGEWRCDLHPRSSPDGRWIFVDSTHGGNGRQLYLIENPCA